MFLNILEQSLIFLPLALGIYVSYVVLRIPDLTTDGSFVLGAAVFGLCIYAGLNPLIALFAAGVSGILAGMAVGFLQAQFFLNPLISGILLVFILNTATLKLLGKPNLSLFDHPSLFSTMGIFNDSDISRRVLLSFIAIICLVGIGFLLISRLGLMLYAFGNNATLLSLHGKNAKAYRMFGLALSNGLVGFCGALTAQSSGYVDIGMGTGIILIALGTVIIGQQLYLCFFKRPPFAKFIQLFFCFIGVIAYFFVVNFFISLGLDPIYLRLMIGVCLVGFLVMTREKKGMEVLA